MHIEEKFLHKIIKIIVIIYAIIGFILINAYFAIKLKLTNDPGTTDLNSRYLTEVYEKLKKDSLINKDNIDVNRIAYLFYKLKILEEYYPTNAQQIIKIVQQGGNFYDAEKMFEAVSLVLKDNQEYQNKLKESEKIFIKNKNINNIQNNAFSWINLDEWQNLKEAIIKDKEAIDSASKVTGVEARLIVACLVGEQIRLFNSKRETYKKILAPLKILSIENIYSYGVTGIKVKTARKVFQNLIDENSPFYLGKGYEKLLNDTPGMPDTSIILRLVNFKNHFYSYLYTALILKQIKVQWERAGYPISDRPEILATLYNVGFEKSIPKANPQVGGSRVEIGDLEYTFGRIAFEFYYSGELIEYFPFEKIKWKEPEFVRQ